MPYESFKHFNKQFQDAPLDDYVNLPEGIYTAKIDDCGPGAFEDGREYFEFKLRIALGDFKGAVVSKKQLITETGVGFLKRDLARLNFNCTNLPALLDPAAKPQLTGVFVEIQVKKSVSKKEGMEPKEFTNYYINKMVKPPQQTTEPYDPNREAASDPSDMDSPVDLDHDEGPPDHVNLGHGDASGVEGGDDPFA